MIRAIAAVGLGIALFFLGGILGRQDVSWHYRDLERAARAKGHEVGRYCWVELNHLQPGGTEMLCGAPGLHGYNAKYIK